MTVIKLICSAGCGIMVLGGLAYAAVASLSAARRRPRAGSPEDARPTSVRVGTGG